VPALCRVARPGEPGLITDDQQRNHRDEQAEQDADEQLPVAVGPERGEDVIGGLADDDDQRIIPDPAKGKDPFDAIDRTGADVGPAGLP